MGLGSLSGQAGEGDGTAGDWGRVYAWSVVMPR